MVLSCEHNAAQHAVSCKPSVHACTVMLQMLSHANPYLMPGASFVRCRPRFSRPDSDRCVISSRTLSGCSMLICFRRGVSTAWKPLDWYFMSMLMLRYDLQTRHCIQSVILSHAGPAASYSLTFKCLKNEVVACNTPYPEHLHTCHTCIQHAWQHVSWCTHL